MSDIISPERMKNICKAGQGKDCCRYIIAGAAGISCAKHTELKAEIDSRVEKGLFIAISDNCEGLRGI